MAGHPTVRHDEDLLGQAAIKETVRQAYLAVIGKPTDIAPRLYSAEELAGVPSGAVAQALGVGNPVRAAGLRPGEVVLEGERAHVGGSFPEGVLGFWGETGPSGEEQTMASATRGVLSAARRPDGPADTSGRSGVRGVRPRRARGCCAST